tara:strand:- start:365 stop:1513 length:1149 start_codon:yes stop_codon:yes gene_type:complete
MSKNLLLKGFEVELFTGLQTGEHFGISDTITKDLNNFVQEPDNRNIEYITPPDFSYDYLKSALITPRTLLREWLRKRNLTIIPGSTLSLGDSQKFYRSDPLNAYHEFIESTYASRVVTTSVHINLGIEDLDLLFPAIRLIRCEAALFLALSASSPFLDGVTTGAHSQRWLQFPLTPSSVPIFLDHPHYVRWIEQQLANGNMKNERHLWSSIRPNGQRRPYLLDRMELRICDLITNPDSLLAITFLLELRVLNLLRNPEKFDPLISSQLSVNDLEKISTLNDMSAAKESLNSNLTHWFDGRKIICKDWISELLEEVNPLASEMNMIEKLTPIYNILEKGNQAMRWLNAHYRGKTIQQIIQEGIELMEEEEKVKAIDIEHIDRN